MDFLAEVYRSLAVLDGAILVVSAKDGVQAQTRVLFHALQKMKIPTIIFVNKIDQEGIDLQSVYQNIREKLSDDVMVMQDVSLTPEVSLTDIEDIEKWDSIIAGNDELLEKYIAGEPLKIQDLHTRSRVKNAKRFPVSYLSWSAKNNIGTEKLIEVIAETFTSGADNDQSELCGSVFKIEYTDQKKRLVYLRLYSGTLHLRIRFSCPKIKN